MDIRTGEIFVGEEIAKAFFELPPGSRQFLQQMFLQPTPIQMQEKRVGRNDPCPCGSGIKFKRCCYLGGG